MNKNKYRRLLAFLSVCSIPVVAAMTFTVVSMLHDIYIQEPSLRYWYLTMILGLSNGVPSEAAAILLLKYTHDLKINAESTLLESRLLLLLRNVFLAQSAITFFSYNLIGILENEGPPFFLLMVVFIVTISLVLATLFELLRIRLKEDYPS